jgi:hypothetical protein
MSGGNSSGDICAVGCVMFLIVLLLIAAGYIGYLNRVYP